MRVLRGRADSLDADRAATADMVERTRETGTPGLRVWRPHCQVAFGRRDTRADGYEQARQAAESAGFSPIERSVGGRAVAYTGTTVAVALSKPTEDVRTGIAERYDDALHAIQRALWRLGVPAQQHEPAHAFCPGGHSLSWNGKIVGVAQHVRSDVALVGAVVVVDDHSDIAEVLEPVYAALSIPFDSDTVGSIAKADGRADPDTVIDQIEAVFVEVDGGTLDVETI